MNAAHLFEKVQGTVPCLHLPNRSGPPSSPSFCFTSAPRVKSSRYECSTGQKPWYERMPQSSWLRVAGLDFDGLAVEPCSVVDVWPEAGVNSSLGGVSPDIVARLPTRGANAPRFVLIENKITYGAVLNPNQVSAYPELIRFLEARKIEDLLVIPQPVGCSQRLYAATKSLQIRLPERFTRATPPAAAPARASAHTSQLIPILIEIRVG
jgi:hypothetical protein